MKIRSLMLVLLLIASIFSLGFTYGGELSFDVSPVKEEIDCYPGTVISVPVRVTNTGEEGLNNLTLSLIWRFDGGVYTANRTVSVGINESRVFSISVRVPELPPGKYNLTLIGTLGNVTVKRTLLIMVLPSVAYSLSIEGKDEYFYGGKVSLGISVVSSSNRPIGGPMLIKILKNSTTVYEKSWSVNLDPGDSSSYEVTLHGLDVGEYSVKLSANLSGVYREVVKVFKVSRRSFSYSVEYLDGRIVVSVRLKNGTPVKGIKVSVNGHDMTTDESGTVEYPTSSPGLYEIKLELDGLMEVVPLYVGRLFINYEIAGEYLRISVVDSSGNPVPNATVSVAAPKGTYDGKTDERGRISFKLSELGYGAVSIVASARNYVGSNIVVQIPSPSFTSPSVTTSSPSSLNSTTQSPNTTAGNPKTGRGVPVAPIAAVLAGLGVFASTFYVSFFRPHIIEEELDRYYFVKLRAPRLRQLRNFRWERSMNAVEARTTKGTARVSGSSVVWEIEELPPGDEAILQVILG